MLREVARRIFAACRTSDVVGRCGGEEFPLVLPETFAGDGVTTGNKIRRVLSEDPIQFDDLRIAVTASIGVAEFDPGMRTAELYEAADRALYRAKELGRNRTELYRPTPVSSQTNSAAAAAVSSGRVTTTTALGKKRH